MKIGVIFFFLLPIFIFAKPRHVYLTWEKDPCTSMMINVHHLKNPMQSIYYDETSYLGDLKKYRYHLTLQGKPFNDRFLFHFNLEDLTPGKKYYFIVGDEEEGFSEEKAFKTIALDSSHYRFIAGGDWEVTEAAKKLAVEAAKLNPSAIFLGGDYPRNANVLSDFEKWDEWLDNYTSTMISPDGNMIPMIMAIGNHEVLGSFGQTPDKAPFYYNYFKQNLKNKSYFSKHMGNNIMLFVLDSGHTASIDGDQLKWLNRSLEKNTSVPIKFAIYHVPIYPSIRFKEPSSFFHFMTFILHLRGEDHLCSKLLSEGSALEEKYWIPLFDRYHLTSAFEHHDQTLKRTKLLKGGKKHPEGTLYLGDGAWGPLGQFTPIQTCFHSYFAKTVGHVPFFWLIDVEKMHIIYRAVTCKGCTIDSFEQEVKKYHE